MANIVIIGAGPVGLWTALQIKKRVPAASIVMYERHTTYQRSHVLRLDYWSLLLYSRKNRNPSEQAFYTEVTGKRVAGVQLGFANSLYIRTNDLESALRDYALREGIVIEYRKIQGVYEAEALHPECTVFIGSDGAHSPLRQELLGSEDVVRSDLQHVVEMKFEEEGGPRKLDIRQMWSCNRQLHFTATDHVGRKKGQTTPVTLRLLLDEQTYGLLPEMSFKAPGALDDARLPDAIRSDVETYLRFRAKTLGTRYVEGSARLSKLVLSLYAAKRFGIRRGDKAWFLVGDAAMGVPYFRALNCGMMLGSRLAMLLGRNGGVSPDRLSRLIGRFERRRMIHAGIEFAIARSKDGLIQGLKAVRARCAKPEVASSRIA
jgi:2-polyprenyl-6-methoxyphenol hydroxylase-like FAD-dependent oxidoreductase